jgi:hypothetical protein
MKPVISLRIASVLTLFHAILHTIGGVFGKPAPGVATTVAAIMRSRFPAFGVMRSYSDFYLGMGLAVSIFLTVEAIAFWILASMAKSDSARLRPLLAIFLLGYLALAINSFAFFFAAPVIAELLIAACIAVAIFTVTSTARDAIPAEQSLLDSARP